MSADPLISVVIPAHNAAVTLGETLDSLFAQSVTDWEAIVVDDGSTDDTGRVIASYAERDARIRLIAQPGSGASGARNTGIAAARGQWLMFLDSDDWVDPEFMRVMYDAVTGRPGAIASFCAYRRVMPSGRMTEPRIHPTLERDPMAAFAVTCATAIHTVLIDRATLLRAGPMDTSLLTCEDWDLWQRVVRLGGDWVRVEQTLSYYRASPRSLTTRLDRMIADATVVIHRGFQSDPRIADPDPRYVNGAALTTPDAPDRALALFALWAAALDRAAGGKGEFPDALLAPLTPDRETGEAIAGHLFDASLPGLAIAEEEFAGRWPSLAPGLLDLIGRLARLWGNGEPARRIVYRIEDFALAYDDLSAPRPLTHTIGLRLPFDGLSSLTPPQGVDRVHAYFVERDRILGGADFGILGRMPADQLRSMQQLMLPGVRAPGRRAHLRRGGWKAWRKGQRIARRVLGTGSPASDTHAGRLATITAAAGQEAVSRRVDAKGDPLLRSSEPLREGDRQEFWENLFQTENPWGYESAYEQQKYERQLALLPPEPVSNALELACAEGHFTAQLAPRVGRLTATDISATALGRARERSEAAGRDNIDYRTLDLSADAIPPGMDLIFCSEVLYYLSDRDELTRVAAKLADALQPGGWLVTAHAFVLTDDMGTTGFDWDNPFGAATIAEVFGATPGLVREQTLQTELYRIDRYRKLAPGDVAPTPKMEEAEVTEDLMPDVARYILWGGATVRRGDVLKSERRDRIPVLMYHGVSDDGPAALARYRVTPLAFRDQLRWLRSNGYHAIYSEELRWFIDHQEPFPGRPVMITFDDGFQDFADNAWPLLRDHDLTAEMFVVTDHVGGGAVWDAAYGTPTPLMDAATIARLATEGVHFGSHLASHRAMDTLSTEQLAQELLRSRAALAEWTGKTPASVAAPFSITDQRFVPLAAECGFRVAFGNRSGAALLSDSALDLPRIEIKGDMTIEAFAAAMEATR